MWIEFAARYFTLNEVDVMLEIIIKRVTPDKVCFELLIYKSIFDRKNYPFHFMLGVFHDLV